MRCRSPTALRSTPRSAAHRCPEHRQLPRSQRERYDRRQHRHRPGWQWRTPSWSITRRYAERPGTDHRHHNLNKGLGRHAPPLRARSTTQPPRTGCRSTAARSQLNAGNATLPVRAYLSVSPRRYVGFERQCPGRRQADHGDQRWYQHRCNGRHYHQQQRDGHAWLPTRRHDVPRADRGQRDLREGRQHHLTLTNIENYTGPTNIYGGTLTLQDAGALPSTPSIAVNYGTLAINDNGLAGSTSRTRRGRRSPSAAACLTYAGRAQTASVRERGRGDPRPGRVVHHFRGGRHRASTPPTCARQPDADQRRHGRLQFGCRQPRRQRPDRQQRPRADRRHDHHQQYHRSLGDRRSATSPATCPAWAWARSMRRASPATPTRA